MLESFFCRGGGSGGGGGGVGEGVLFRWMTTHLRFAGCD